MCNLLSGDILQSVQGRSLARSVVAEVTVTSEKNTGTLASAAYVFS